MKEMFLITPSVEEMEKIREALRRIAPDQQTKILRKAQRETAKQARERLAERAKESYTVKNVGFKKEMAIRQRGGSSAPAAIIYSSGHPLPLIQFKTSRRAGVAKAQVVKSGHLKTLRRSFINNIAEKDSVRRRDTAKGKKGSLIKHFGVAERQGKARLHIEEKYSNSVPVMLGSGKHVYGIVEPLIGSDLQKNLERFVSQALGS